MASAHSSILRRAARLVAVLALAACGPATATFQAKLQPAPASAALEIHFLDVGQGDAILITLGHRAVLVDAGRGDDIVAVLRDYHVDSLVAVIASHNHQDHIGGMDAVLSDFPIGRYLSNGRPPGNYNAKNVETWLRRNHISHPPPPWAPIQLEDVRITVFPTNLENPEENNASLGVLIERGSFRALLTGDSQIEELNSWLAAGRGVDVDVLKAAHHGSRNGVSPGWLDRTRPEVVVISVGAGNSYGHPDPWALRYYQTHGRKVFRTDLDGTVTVTVDRAGAYHIETAGPIQR